MTRQARSISKCLERNAPSTLGAWQLRIEVEMCEAGPPAECVVQKCLERDECYEHRAHISSEDQAPACPLCRRLKNVAAFRDGCVRLGLRSVVAVVPAALLVLDVGGAPSRPRWHHDLRLRARVRSAGQAFHAYGPSLGSNASLAPTKYGWSHTFEIASAAGAEITLAPSKCDAGTPITRYAAMTPPAIVEKPEGGRELGVGMQFW